MTEELKAARQPKWHQRATREEINEIEAIDRFIADLRRRRQGIINRTRMRTDIWLARWRPRPHQKHPR
jgi:hypothetical protein